MAAQRADNIIVDGETLDLFSNPLEDYWINLKKKKPSFTKEDEECRRGYIATWEIRDNGLYLVDIQGEVEKRTIFLSKKKVKYTLKSLFKKAPSTGVKATWFIGKLRIPRGKMTQYEHSGYDSRFEREVIITVDDGDVLKTRTLDYTQRTLTVS